MQQKVSLVSGRKNVNVLRILFYTFLFLMGLLMVHNLNAKTTTSEYIDKTGQDKQNEAINISSPWHSYLWNPWNDDDAAEENRCKFQDYVLRQRVHQTDPCLIATVKNTIILSPPPPNELNTTKLSEQDELPSNIEKYKWIEKLLIEDNNTQSDSRWPGFFVDCGANDGKFISPTIRLERNYNWTGLLVEANPTPFEDLKKLKRNAWAANVASCTTEYPDQLTFYTDPADKGVGTAGFSPRPVHTINFTVQCIPMYTMLAALEVDTVDFLSLDVEGFELAVLETIPFDKVLFKVMAVEYNHIPGTQEALKTFLEPKGYRFVKEIHDYLTEDCLYVHESLYDKATQIKF